MPTIQEIFNTIRNHVMVLLNGKHDLMNRHWSATRIIVHSQTFVQELPPTTPCPVKPMLDPTPQRIRDLFAEMEADLVAPLTDSIISRLRQNAIELEAAAAITATILNEVLQGCGYYYVGIPPPRVLVST